MKSSSGGSTVASGWSSSVCSGRTANWTPPTLGDARYWWDAYASEGGRNSGWSGEWSFYKDASPPTSPSVSSSTHPNESAWYNNNDPALSWSASDTSGIAGYSYVRDQLSTTTPDDTSEGTATSRSYTDLVDGDHWFHIKAMNGAGVWGGSAQTRHFRIRVDATPPAAPTVTSPTHPVQTTWYANNDPAFSWSDSDTSGIAGYSYVFDTNPTTTPDTASEGTSTTATFVDAGDGSSWFHVRALNGAGSWGAARHYEVRVDVTAPASPAVSSPTHPDQTGWYSATNPQLSWSATDVSGIDGYSYTLDQSAATTPDTTSEGTATTTSYSGLANGTWWFHVRPRNTVGLWGNASHFKLQIDAAAPTAPTISSTTHPTPGTWYATDDVQASWTATSASGIAGYSFTLDQTPATTPDLTAEPPPASRNFADLADGTWWLHVRAQSAAGVWGGTTHFEIRIDDTVPAAPTVTSSTHSSSASWYANDDPSLAWHATDTSGIAGYSYVIDQQPATAADTTSEGTSTGKTYTDLADGVWWFHVRALNSSGLWGPTAHREVRIDDTGPAAPSLSSSTHPSSNTWYADNDPSFSWSAADISGVDGYSYALDASSSTTPDTTSEGTATTTTYADVGDGTWWFHVRARNTAGVWGAATHYKIQVDVTGPATPTVTSPTHPEQDAWYAQDDPSVDWSASDLSGVGAFSYLLDQSASTTPDTVGEGVGATKTYGDVASGVWWFHVRARNAAGVWGDPAHYRIQVDMTTPRLAAIVSSPEPARPGESIGFNGHVEATPIAPVRLLVCRSARVALGECVDGVWAEGVASGRRDLTARYVTSTDDVGRRDYFASACSATGNCSTPLQGYFTVQVEFSGDVTASSHAGGHRPGYYPLVWEPHGVIYWAFASDFPTGDYRARVRDGADQWNQAADDWAHMKRKEIRPFSLEQQGVDRRDLPPETAKKCGDATASPDSVVYWDEIHNDTFKASADTIGITFMCWSVDALSESRWRNSYVVFDENTSWYTGTIDADFGQADLWAAATHEWGHASGWGTAHLDEDGDVPECSRANMATMCKGGNYTTRRLDPEDKAPFWTAYRQAYWVLSRDGGLFNFGHAEYFGSTGAMTLNSPVVNMAAHPQQRGYWFVAADGGVFSFGESRFLGSMGGTQLNQPVVGMSSTPSGNGYWLVAADGGIFSFGDAQFHGSTGALTLNQPIVGMSSTPSGNGYWLVAADGGVFSFGDAQFHGSAAGMSSSRIVGIATPPSGTGYWIANTDGQVWRFGGVADWGNAVGDSPPGTVYGAIVPDTTDLGYRLIGTVNEGGLRMVVRVFGHTHYFGRFRGVLNQAVVGAAVAG